LFLDEPTTGLDPQSRLALWDEVARLAREDGVTVFLTTQYLEEADALADRVGIINKGKIVAEGTPAELKAGIGTARVDVVARRGDDVAVRAALAPLGSLVNTKDGVISVRLGSAELSVVDVVRALDAASLVVSDLSVHEPTLDDVFLAKTGVLLEGAVAGAPGER
jgi:ABC-2 type transport system ATP-binding protein